MFLSFSFISTVICRFLWLFAQQINSFLTDFDRFIKSPKKTLIGFLGFNRMLPSSATEFN